MKTALIALIAALTTVASHAAPLRVALMDVKDLSGMASDPKLGGTIDTSKLAEKAIYSLGRQLVTREDVTVIDRRDFLDQMEKLRPKDLGEPTPIKPSFLQAAQALNADVVLRGNIMSLSTGKQTVNQGGYSTEFSTVSLRVSLEALDAVDGAVIAITDGAVRRQFRQTDATSTTLSEDDVLTMMDEAFAKAIPEVQKAVDARAEKMTQRPKVVLSVKTSEDPAMIEVDGLLIGTSPIDNFEVYQGDHVLTVSKPGYMMITKKVLLDRNTEINVPMLREELTAEEIKTIYEKADLEIIQSPPGLIINSVD